MSKRIKRRYYLGGLADLVPQPSVLTTSFLANWFTTNNSVGKAMEILGLPYTGSNKPLLVRVGGELTVDLAVEEKCLYEQTLLGYNQKSKAMEASLGFKINRLGKLECVMNTGKILMKQTQWIQDPKKVVKRAQELEDELDTTQSFRKIIDLDIFLGDEVWSRYIALDYWFEFYVQLLARESQENIFGFLEYVDSRLTNEDWLLRSMLDQDRVRVGKMKWSQFWKEYGVRADGDFELACPRWSEQKRIIRERIKKRKNFVVAKKTSQIEKKLTGLAETVVELQLCRSRMRKKLLIYLLQLRKLIIGQEGKKADIAKMTRIELIDKKKQKDKKTLRASGIKKIGKKIRSKPQGVSKGVARGKIKKFADVSLRGNGENMIGTLPGAGIEFGWIYEYCQALVFLRGDRHSLGSSLARILGIPAIVATNGDSLVDGGEIEVDGAEGVWREAGLE